MKHNQEQEKSRPSAQRVVALSERVEEDVFLQTDSYLNRLKTTLDAISRKEVALLIAALEDVYERQGTVFICGNGGSASTASHMACDLSKGVSYLKEKRFKVLSLSDNIPTLMAFANDVSYSDIFVEPLKNLLSDGDILIGLSGSGNSENVLKAVEYANSRGNLTIGFTGYKEGRLKEIAGLSVNANVDDMQIAEDVHLILNHLVMQILCRRLADTKVELPS